MFVFQTEDSVKHQKPERITTNGNTMIEMQVAQPAVFRIHIDSPYVTCEEYADRCGLSVRAVRERCIRGELPVAPRSRDGERYMINVALLTKQALEAEY